MGLLQLQFDPQRHSYELQSSSPANVHSVKQPLVSIKILP